MESGGTDLIGIRDPRVEQRQDETDMQSSLSATRDARLARDTHTLHLNETSQTRPIYLIR